MIVYNKKKINRLIIFLASFALIALVIFFIHVIRTTSAKNRAAREAEQQKSVEYKNTIAEFKKNIQGLDMEKLMTVFIAFEQNEKDNPFLNDAKIAVVNQIKNDILFQYKTFDYSNQNSYVEMQELSEKIASFDVLNGTSVFRFSNSYLDMINSDKYVTINEIQVATDYDEGVYFDKCVCLSDGILKKTIFEKETDIILGGDLPYFRTPQTFPCKPWMFGVDVYAYRHKNSIFKKDDDKGWLHCRFAPGEGSKVKRSFWPDDRIGFIISYSISFKTLLELLSDAGISEN